MVPDIMEVPHYDFDLEELGNALPIARGKWEQNWHSAFCMLTEFLVYKETDIGPFSAQISPSTKYGYQQFVVEMSLAGDRVFVRADDPTTALKAAYAGLMAINSVLSGDEDV
jgi:hypothetical protein